MTATPATENSHVQDGYSNGRYRTSPDDRKQSADRTDRRPSVKVEPPHGAEHPMASDSLSPFGVLRRSATSGHFTIANILNVESESQADLVSPRSDHGGDDSYVTDGNDPVNRNMINLSTAQSLFDR